MSFAPDNISTLGPDEVFVFGSNLRGIHGTGAARTAADRFGARRGKGVGLSGKSYALPTKDEHIRTMPIDWIAPFVDEFLDFARANPGKTFLVTKVGCGLAGYEPRDIAPLFLASARGVPSNVRLPKIFYDCLKG